MSDYRSIDTNNWVEGDYGGQPRYLTLRLAVKGTSMPFGIKRPISLTPQKRVIDWSEFQDDGADDDLHFKVDKARTIILRGVITGDIDESEQGFDGEYGEFMDNLFNVLVVLVRDFKLNLDVAPSREFREWCEVHNFLEEYDDWADSVKHHYTAPNMDKCGCAKCVDTDNCVKCGEKVVDVGDELCHSCYHSSCDDGECYCDNAVSDEWCECSFCGEELTNKKSGLFEDNCVCLDCFEKNTAHEKMMSNKCGESE